MYKTSLSPKICIIRHNKAYLHNKAANISKLFCIYLEWRGATAILEAHQEMALLWLSLTELQEHVNHKNHSTFWIFWDQIFFWDIQKE